MSYAHFFKNASFYDEKKGYDTLKIENRLQILKNKESINYENNVDEFSYEFHAGLTRQKHPSPLPISKNCNQTAVTWIKI